MRNAKRVLSVLLVLALSVLTVLPALAQKISPDYVSLYRTGNNIDNEDVLDALVDACTDGLAGLGKKAAAWGAKEILKTMFPGLGESTVDKMSDMMKEMNDQLAGIADMLSSASATLDCAQLTQIVNTVRTSMYSTKAGEAMKDFLKADQFSDVKGARLSSMTTSLGITEDQYTLAQTDFDEYTDYVVKLFTEKYEVTLSGKTYQMDIMEVLHYLMMFKYHWENQAYEEWIAAENDLLDYVTLLIFVDEASVHARRQLCDDRAIPYYSQFDTRLETLQEHTAKVKGLKERTVRKLEDGYRHYWYQGRYDIMFYTEPGNTQIPQENKKAALNTEFGNPFPEGLYVNKHSLEIRTEFWKNFVTYRSASYLTSYSLLNDIYHDYDGKKSLWDIFFSDSEGAFVKPAFGDSEWQSAEWIIDTAEYPLKYIDHLFKGDDLVCRYVKDPGPTGNVTGFKLSTGTQKMCIYHAFSCEPQTTGRAVQIGVFRISDSPDSLHVYGDSVPLPPDTGDDTPLGLYALLLVCGAVMLFAAAAGLKRRVR